MDSKVEHSVDGRFVLYQCKLATLQFRVAAGSNPHPVIYYLRCYVHSFHSYMLSAELCMSYSYLYSYKIEMEYYSVVYFEGIVKFDMSFC